MSDVTLTAALRSNLLSLQGTQKLLDSTQLRLATGLKVNSALDNPSSYFAAQSLNNRAGDLNNLLDGMGQAVQVLKATDEAIKAITSLLQQAQAVAQDAKDALAGGSTDVTSQAASFDEIIAQVDGLAGDSSYRGTNLINAATTTALTVNFSESSTSSASQLVIAGVDFKSASGGGDLTVSDSGGDFADVTAAQGAIDDIKADLATIRAQAATFGSNLSIIQTRQDFTQNLINVLREGSDKLTLADKNEEGAKLLSLQTSQQLGITSLSLASQANQSILRLFQ
ncbi:MAG: flagellin [Alphaproteobacteria bacterium]